MTTENFLYLNNNHSGTSETSEFRSYNISAKKLLMEGKLKEAHLNFRKAHSLHGSAYCEFLMGKYNEALTLLYLVKDSSSHVNWLISLINIIENNTNYPPTYMQVRNYYEQDLNMLFFYQQHKAARKVISETHYFELFNKEIYKYNARILFNNGMPELAEEYIKHSIDIFYNDPENHYILGEIYLKTNKTEKAKQEFYIADSITGCYMPAQKKLKEIN